MNASYTQGDRMAYISAPPSFWRNEDTRRSGAVLRTAWQYLLRSVAMLVLTTWKLVYGCVTIIFICSVLVLVLIPLHYYIGSIVPMIEPDESVAFFRFIAFFFLGFYALIAWGIMTIIRLMARWIISPVE